MHPPLTHGFPGLLRKKAVWGDWVVSPVWIVMEPAAVPRKLAVSPHGFRYVFPRIDSLGRWNGAGVAVSPHVPTSPTASKTRSKSFAKEVVTGLAKQAKDYAKSFKQVVYQSNSQEFLDALKKQLASDKSIDTSQFVFKLVP